jgi:hypothetical protein
MRRRSRAYFRERFNDDGKTGLRGLQKSHRRQVAREALRGLLHDWLDRVYHAMSEAIKEPPA